MCSLSFSVLVCSLFFILLFHLIHYMLEICFPLFSFSRDHIYWLGSLVLLTEFSYVTWKFIFTFCNNIKEQQVSKKKVWPLPIYTLNANSDKLGQMKTANTCPISVKSGQDASRPRGMRSATTLKNKRWWSAILVAFETGVTTVFA